MLALHRFEYHAVALCADPIEKRCLSRLITQLCSLKCLLRLRQGFCSRKVRRDDKCLDFCQLIGATARNASFCSRSIPCSAAARLARASVRRPSICWDLPWHCDDTPHRVRLTAFRSVVVALTFPPSVPDRGIHARSPVEVLTLAVDLSRVPSALRPLRQRDCAQIWSTKDARGQHWLCRSAKRCKRVAIHEACSAATARQTNSRSRSRRASLQLLYIRGRK